jgi:hypothetical protein
VTERFPDDFHIGARTILVLTLRTIVCCYLLLSFWVTLDDLTFLTAVGDGEVLLVPICPVPEYRQPLLEV